MEFGSPEDPGESPDAYFERMYRNTYRHTLAYAMRRTPSAHDAHDVVADTYLVAWRRLDELRLANTTQAWLYGVAYRTILNRRRSDRRRADLVERALNQGVAAPSDVEGPAEKREDLRIVEAALAALPPRDQEVLRLAAYEELDHKEIAVVLGIKAPLVRTMLYRSRKRLNKALSDSPARQETGSGHRTDKSIPNLHDEVPREENL